jgi:pyruvate/2-oxoglutarate dehydrogenase complex dihydrolipoamide acyltransferase (E2) component
MASIEIRIPQLGEGLHEARIVRFLKQPGESVARDEPIYEMETDKAVMEIESPSAGTLESWSANEDEVLPIGAVVGTLATEVSIEPAEGADMRMSLADIPDEPVTMERDGHAAPEPETAAPAVAVAPSDLLRNDMVPPRTRAYARERGISNEELMQLAGRTDGKVLPQAIDAYLLGRGSAPTEKSPRRTPQVVIPPGVAFVDSDLSSRQRTLNFRLQRSAQTVIPATMEVAVEWSGIEAARAKMKERYGDRLDRAPTQFLLFAWCVAQATREHPAFRSALAGDKTLRRYAHLNLGIAVARPGDELVMARVDNADALGLEDFTEAALAAIERARGGEDQTSDAMQLSLTNMAGAGVQLGIPVVVAPAVGTLFIGAPYDQAVPLPSGGVGFRRQANMVFTFDHRLANGIGAARFLSDIRERVEGFDSPG